MIIYKKPDLLALLESKRDRMITQIGGRKDYAVRRCFTCGLLFQCWKMYQFKTCSLCRYEQYPQEKLKLENHAKKNGEIFDEDLFYATKLRIHLELEEKKRRINQAFKVTVKNEPVCLRII